MNPFRLAWVHFRIGAMNEMQYRVNFFVQLLHSGLALGTGLIALALVFAQTDELNGWSNPELLAVMGIHILMGGIIQTFIQPNMERLMTDVREGTLDYPLTKPVDSQAMVSVREVRVWHLVDVILGVIILIVALVDLGGSVGPIDAAAFIVAMVLGGLMIYSFWLLLTTGAFWIIRIENVLELFQGVYAAGRWPVGIYPLWLRSGLTFIVPVAFAVTVPAQSVTDRLDGTTLLGAFGLAMALMAVARLVWRFGLTRYSGASA